jgi:hypothetical protein
MESASAVQKIAWPEYPSVLGIPPGGSSTGVLTLRATAQQKKQKQDRNRNSQEPQQNVPCSPYLLDLLFEFHIDLILSLSVITSKDGPRMTVWKLEILSQVVPLVIVLVPTPHQIDHEQELEHDYDLADRALPIFGGGFSIGP